MNIFFWALIGFALWFGVELGIQNRKARIASQSVLIAIIAIVSFSLGSLFSGFSLKLQANNQVKNLTRGLITITKNDDLDKDSLEINLRDLDSGIIPTYENMTATKESISDFLEKYGIAYEEEIPITSNNTVL